MKILAKSALALAIAATTSVPTFAAMGDEPDVIGVTGRFRMAVECNDDTCDVANYSSRFRMAAEQDMGNGNTVFGKYEFGVGIDNGDNPSTRLAYVGVKGGFGELSMGTRWGTFYNAIISPSDYTQAYGGTWTNSGVGYFSGFRESNSIFYSIGNFNAMVTVDGSSADDDDVDAIEASYSLPLGGWNVNLALSDKESRADTLYGVNVNGHAGPVRIAVGYSDLDGDSAILAQVQAPVGGGTLSFSFGDDDLDREMVALEFEKPLGSSSRWFVGAEQDNDGSGDAERYGAGIRYDF